MREDGHLRSSETDVGGPCTFIRHKVNQVPPTRRNLIQSFTLLPIVALSGCDRLVSHARFFRYEIWVSYDGREYRGSSVYQVSWSRNIINNFDAAGYYSVDVKGQAPFAVLPNIGPVFALLQSPEDMKGFSAVRTAAALQKYKTPGLKAGSPEEFEYLMNLSGEHELDTTGDQAPVVVYFAKGGDFMSVRLLPKGGTIILDKKLFLSRASLTLTDEPLTRNITAAMLPTFDGRFIHPRYVPHTGLPRSGWPLGAKIQDECFNSGDLRK